MLPFELRKEEQEVQRHILRLLNSHRAESDILIDDARVEQRANLTIPVLIVPIEAGKPVLEETFVAVTKDFSSNGISLIIRERLPYGELILGLLHGDSAPGKPELSFVQCKVRHHQTLTEGIVQLGVQLRRLVDRDEYPELAVLEPGPPDRCRSSGTGVGTPGAVTDSSTSAGTRGRSAAIGLSPRADRDRKVATVEQCDRSDLGSDARATESPPSTTTNTDKAAGQKSRPGVRRLRARKEKRDKRRAGEPVTIELRGSGTVSATILDESSSGMAIVVVDNTLFYVGQRVAVRRHGMRIVAFVRYVQSEADTWRVGLKLQPA